MQGTAGAEGERGRSEGTWDGVDLSGLTVVLGAGTGQMIELLNQGAATSDGTLLVLSQPLEPLQALASHRESGPLTLVRGRFRDTPVLSETADLVVANGVMRQVPPAQLERMGNELWRMMVPGGRLRISDIIEPSEADYDRVWSLKNTIVRKIASALNQPTALSVDIARLVRVLRAVGFEELGLSLFPGVPLTDAWLEETVNAIQVAVSRIVDVHVRHGIMDGDLRRLVAAYAEGEQRAAERFVLRARKPGDLALAMEASFVEEDLVTLDDEDEEDPDDSFRVA